MHPVRSFALLFPLTRARIPHVVPSRNPDPIATHDHTQSESHRSRSHAQPQGRGQAHARHGFAAVDPAAAAASPSSVTRQRGAPVAGAVGSRAQLPPGRIGGLGRGAGAQQPRSGRGLHLHGRGCGQPVRSIHRDGGGAGRGAQHRRRPPTRSTIGTEHALGGLAERGVSTAGILRRYGISSETMASRLADAGADQAHSGQDSAAQAKAGEAEAGLCARGPDARPAGAADAGRIIATWSWWEMSGVGTPLAGGCAGAADGRGQRAGGAATPWCRSPTNALLSDAEKAVESGWRRRATASSSCRTSNASSAAPRHRRVPEGHPRRPARLPGAFARWSSPRRPMPPGMSGWPPTASCASTATGCACPSRHRRDGRHPGRPPARAWRTTTASHRR